MARAKARYAMTIDLEACVGCTACAVACTLEHQVPPGEARLVIQTFERGQYPRPGVEFRPEACQHCEGAPCVEVCPTKASHYTPDGLVLITPSDCIACEACIEACPYGARYMHPDGYADKCSFCAHRVAQGRVPACVETCPVDARVFGDLLDARSPIHAALANAKRVSVRLPREGTKPKLFYLNAPQAELQEA